MVKNSIKLAVIFISMVLINSCSSDHQAELDDSYRESTQNVERLYVISNAWFPTLEFDQVVIDNSDSNLASMVSPFTLDVSNKGNIYVFDFSLHQIFLFNSNGELITHWGTPGNGPTDLGGTVSLTAVGENVIVAGGRNMTRVFSSSGKLLRVWHTISVSQDTQWSPRGEILGVNYFDLVQCTLVNSRRTRPTLSFSSAIYDEQGRLVTVLADWDQGDGAYLSKGGMGAIVPWLPELSLTCYKDRYICWGYGEYPSINIYDISNNTNIKISVRIHQQALSRAEIVNSAALRAVSFDGSLDQNMYNYLIRNIPYPKYKPYFDKILIDKHGCIWLRDSIGGWSMEPRLIEEGEKVAYNLFTFNGEYLGTLSAPTKIMKIMDTYLYSLERSKTSGILRVIRYTLHQ